MNTWSDEQCAWLALSFIAGLGNALFKRLIARFRTARNVLEAGMTELMGVAGMREEVARKIVHREFVADPERELRRVESCRARILRYADPEYPPLLKEISSPPMLLYAKGEGIPHSHPFVAVIGSRSPTYYGVKVAEKLGRNLAARGVGVVSGLARGIDSAAHRGCLTGGAFTIAVMGTGIDTVYPRQNQALFDQVVEHGCAVSEFPIGTPPEPRNFPIRNRIISGLARGVAVVEATMRSGSLITASMALDQGREVFAVPGSIESSRSSGAHALIKQGAKLIENADDILEEIHRMVRPSSGPDEDGHGARYEGLGEAEKRIYDLIGTYPMHIDDIVRRGGIVAGEVSGILMKLELMGMITQLPGKMFVR